jgi:hypothetical protein
MLCATVSITCGRFEGSRRSYTDLWDAMQRHLQATSMMPHPARQLLAHIPSATAHHGSLTGSATLTSPDQRKEDLSSTQHGVGPRERQPASVGRSPNTSAAPLASTTAGVAGLKSPTATRHMAVPPCPPTTTRGGHHHGANTRPGPPQQTTDNKQLQPRRAFDGSKGLSGSISWNATASTHCTISSSWWRPTALWATHHASTRQVRQYNQHALLAARDSGQPVPLPRINVMGSGQVAQLAVPANLRPWVHLYRNLGYDDYYDTLCR